MNSSLLTRFNKQLFIASVVMWSVLMAFPAHAQVTRAEVDACLAAAGSSADNSMTPECFALVQQWDAQQAAAANPLPTPPVQLTPEQAAQLSQSGTPVGGTPAANPQSGTPVGGTPTQTTGTGQSSVTLQNPLANISTIPDLLAAILQVMVIIAIPIIIFFIIMAGFKYVTARGNAKQIEEASRALLYAIIGGVLIIGATAIAQIIKNLVNAFRA